MQGINELLGEETADISAADAEAMGIEDGEKNFRQIPAGRGGGEGPRDPTEFRRDWSGWPSISAKPAPIG